MCHLVEFACEVAVKVEHRMPPLESAMGHNCMKSLMTVLTSSCPIFKELTKIWMVWPWRASDRFFLGKTAIPQITDLFALGTTLYEVMTGHEPYEELTEQEAADLYANRNFPTVDGISGGHVIQKCWMAAYISAEEVVHDISCLYEELGINNSRC
jgi:hypothetical protein